MGLGFSRTRADPTPHEMLEIGKLSTLEETKKAYCRIFYHSKGNHEKMRELNVAYNFCRNSLDVDLYHELFQKMYSAVGEKSSIRNKGSVEISERNGKLFVEHRGCSTPFDFNTVSNDFFERLSLCFELKCTPKFFDPDFVRFYNFWMKFSHVDRALEGRVRRVVKTIRDNDPRMALSRRDGQKAASCKTSRQNVAAESSSLPSRQKKIWKSYCDVCKKGFNSENTMKDHLNSKQHKSNKAKLGGDLSTITVLDACGPCVVPDATPDDNVSVAEVVREEVAAGEGLVDAENDLDTDRSQALRSEHPLLRTCHACKRILRTRGELIVHLRTEHSA